MRSKKHNIFGKGTKQRAVNGGLDDYYTNPKYALHCCKMVHSKCYRFKINNIVEPSAGSGVFYEGIKLLSKNGSINISMYDISPKGDGVEKANFFDLTLKPETLVIGNPPFGFSSSLAINFFNHAASFKVKLIAFILPKTFKKDSIQNKLNKNYHMIYEEDCPKNNFLLDEKIYDVPCVFQVWKYSNKKRKIKIWDLTNKWVEFTSKDKADFCIRRVGGKAGQVLEDPPSTYSITSTYFCREKVRGVKEVIRGIDFDDVVNSTAGIRSLSKREIHSHLHRYYQGDI